MSEAADAQQPALDPENTLYMELKDNCRVTIRLRPDLAPKMVERVKTLTRQGFYNGTPFHRVIEGFMAQGGDPSGTGSGGSQLPNVPAEFSQSARTSCAGRWARRAPTTRTARTASSSSCSRPAPHLDGQYTIFGQVVQGMDCVDKIKRGSGSGGSVSDPDKIIRMQVAADAHG